MELNKIRKALDSCSRFTGGCHDCPYRIELPSDNCVRNLIYNAKLFIDAQNNEINKLAYEIENERHKYTTTMQAQSAEITRLNDFIYSSVIKKPIKKKLTWHCPTCNAKLKNKHQNYCSECGQPMDIDNIT